MNRSIQAIIIYILNDFKHVYNKTYFDLSVSIGKDLRAADLMIKNMKLIKNFQANAFFNNDFVKSFSITVNKINIIKIDTSTSLTRAVVFKSSILNIVFIISCKALQVEKID